MGRYLKTLGLFWSTAAAAEMEYRLNFVISTVASLGGLAGSLFALHLFYRTGARLSDWSWQHALMVLGMFTFLDGVSETVLRPNLSRIVQHVQHGTLDFVLLKPIDSQFWLSMRNFSPFGLPNVLLGAALAAVSASLAGSDAGALLLGIVPVAASVVVLYSLWFVLGAMSIWFVKIYNATEVLRSFLEAGRYPVSAYPPMYRFVFTFVVPVAFMTTVPAETALGRSGPGWVLATVALAAGLFGASRCFWRFAQRYYTSASS